MDSVDVLSFLSGVRDVCELLAALPRYCNAAGIEALEAIVVRAFVRSHQPCQQCATTAGSGSTPFPSEPKDDSVTHDMLLIAQLCISQDVAQATYHHHDPITELGRLAVQRIASSVLHNSALDERQLTLALAVSTVSNVLAARHLCLAALQASVNPSNCFSIFRFADVCAIMPLRQAAGRCCLAHMPCGAGPAQDVQGFSLLLPEQLTSLLQANSLQVPSEIAVFKAITAWVHANPSERTALMGDLVRNCVRLGTADLRELEQLDQDPEVQASVQLTRIVAYAYVSRLMGTATQCQGKRCRVVHEAHATAAVPTRGSSVASPEGATVYDRAGAGEVQRYVRRRLVA
ncbi:hypothetical protein Agub_g10777 [Astrephomene gubernaculifera]|uniref:BACK domain-containing protein n=1 Tax=Astrephomene gubernaculifera TaxID=47775 RepID=A0AAD3DVE8_9CHLO|nr:hypothetical protein Agub_g10777 [Astrephomene gubernaculifera]